MNTTTVGGSPATTSRRVARGVTVTALTTILVTGLAACQTGQATSSADTSEGQRVGTSQRIDAAAAQLRALQEQYAGMPADRIEQAIADYTAAMRESVQQRVDAAAAQQRALQEQYAGMPADRIEQAIADATAAMREQTDASASRDQDVRREHRLADRIE